jgi:hypothetical protein
MASSWYDVKGFNGTRSVYQSFNNLRGANSLADTLSSFTITKCSMTAPDEVIREG